MLRMVCLVATIVFYRRIYKEKDHFPFWLGGQTADVTTSEVETSQALPSNMG